MKKVTKITVGTTPEATASGKSISTQLSDLRLENKAIRKLYNGQQAQINELQGQLAQLWQKVGV